MLTAGDTLKNKVWQIRVDDDFLQWLKAAAESKGLSAAAYLRMVAIDRMVEDGVPKPPPRSKKPKKNHED